MAFDFDSGVLLPLIPYTYTVLMCHFLLDICLLSPVMYVWGISNGCLYYVPFRLISPVIIDYDMYHRLL